MSLAAGIQITDQDVNQVATTRGGAYLGQFATTPKGLTFEYALAGGNLTAGQLSQPASFTANYATRTLGTSYPIGTNQITVTLGTTAASGAFAGYWLVVTDGTGKGQGAYQIFGNTAATAGTANATTITIANGIMSPLDTTSVVGLYPSQQSAVVQHIADSTLPTSGAPVINVTSGQFFWNQVGGYASILSAGAITKNAGAIPSGSVAGAATIELAATVTQRIGYAPEVTVDTKYSPLVLTVAPN